MIKFNKCVLTFLLFSCSNPLPEVTTPKNPVAKKVEIAVVPQKRVLVTIDDLPVAMRTLYKNSEGKEIANGICDALKKYGVPAIGFLNMANANDEPDAMNAWKSCTNITFGNHTWSHPRLGKVGIKKYLADVRKGHHAVQALVDPDATIYFRYPYLYEGFDPVEQTAIRDALRGLESPNVPVTIETSDWYYARGYAETIEKDPDGAARYVDSWRWDVEESTMVAEWYSDALFDHNPPQVVLLHANLLNARFVETYFAWLHKRGYIFVSVEEVLADPAFQIVPQSVSPSGDTHWQHIYRDQRTN